MRHVEGHISRTFTILVNPEQLVASFDLLRVYSFSLQWFFVLLIVMC